MRAAIVHHRGPLVRRGCIVLLILLVPLLQVACASSPETLSPPDAPGLRVMSYNIYAGNDLERRSNLARIASLVDSLAVDVVFLQEVDIGTVRSGRIDQAARIADLAGLHVVFGRSMHYDDGGFGNAILSRWPIVESNVAPLAVDAPPDVAGHPNEPRSVLHVVVMPAGRTVHLLNTHLDHRPEPLLRRAQVVDLLAYVAEAIPRRAQIVFGGDLNARPDAPEIRALAVLFDDAWGACGEGPGFTFRTDRPERRIDYVLLAGLDCDRAWVPAVDHSDHRPVMVDVVFPAR